MKDHCTCDFRRIEQTFSSEGIIYCVDCRQPLCCGIVLIDPRVEPHAAEFGDEEHFACWAHLNSVANLALFASTPGKSTR